MLCRWRRHLLDPKRELHIGPGMHVDVSHLYDLVGADKPLREGDLNYSDKQHWSATNHIFSIETLVALQLKIGEWEHKRDQVASTQGAATSDHVENPFWGTFTFIKMGYHLKAAWLEDDDPHDAIHHAAFYHVTAKGGYGRPSAFGGRCPAALVMSQLSLVGKTTMKGTPV